MNTSSFESLPPLVLVLIGLILVLNAILWFFLPFYVRLINMRVKELNETLGYIKITIKRMASTKTIAKKVQKLQKH
jgi:hypothetical protein